MIDYRTTLLPDSITLPFLWLGLLVNINGIFTDLGSAVVGAIAGYLSLWSIYWGFKLITGKDGMGFGDFKLLALLGAWMGWQMLPVIVLLSSFAGAVVGLSLIALGRDKDLPIPFGPYLAIAGWMTLIWGESLTASYFELLGGS
jgi:leader peptidase (prepilin peptidase)/N-methyltransferase